MTRLNCTFLLVMALTVFVAIPALAADPTVNKKVLTDDDGTSVVVLDVSARGKAVYGITVKDASGSIEDVVAPDGWAAVAAGDMVVFRTVDKPIASGKSIAFRIVTKNQGASLDVLFRDSRSMFGGKKTI